IIFPRPEDLGVESYTIGPDFSYCYKLETIYIPDGSITIECGAFGYEIGQYDDLSADLEEAYTSNYGVMPGSQGNDYLAKVKNVFIGGNNITFVIYDGAGDSDAATANGKMVPFFGILNAYLGDAGWIPDNFLSKVEQAGCRIYVADDTNLPECYEYYSSIIETSNVVGTNTSVSSKMAAYEATYAPTTQPTPVLQHTGVVLNVVLQSVVIGLVALATVVVCKKKEQF
ncbi:MAG: hypothetical protein J6T39_00470, partial [Clostridia bacterium]|nr:hypothetical protein [Clostridia bacterium]